MAVSQASPWLHRAGGASRADGRRRRRTLQVRGQVPAPPAMEEKAILGVPWTLGALGANKVVGTLTLLVLTRLLTPADFGLMGIALLAVNFLLWFGGYSFSSTLVVRQDLDEPGKRTLCTLMLASSVAVALVSVALAPVMARIFNAPRVTGLLSVLAISVVVTAFASFYDALLQRELEFRRRFVCLTAQNLSNAGISIGLALSGMGVWSLVIGQLASSVVYAAFLLVLVPSRIRPGLDRAQVRPLLITGRGFLTQGVMNFVRSNVDTITVGRAFGVAPLGFYSMAWRIGDLTYWAIADPVGRVTFPAFARSRVRGEDIGPSFLSVLRMVALVACPIGVILSGAADPFTRAVFGEHWLRMIGPLTVIGIWAALRPLDATLGMLLNAAGRAGSVGLVSALILVPLVPGFVLASQVGMLTAIAIVVLVDTLLSMSLLSMLTRRHVEIHLAQQWRAVAPIAVAAVPTWLASFGIARAIGTHQALLALVLSVLGGLTAYGLTLSLISPKLLPHARTQVLRIFGRGPGAGRPPASGPPHDVAPEADPLDAPVPGA